MKKVLIISSTVTYPIKTWGHERVYNIAEELGKKDNLEVRVYSPYVRFKEWTWVNQVKKRENFNEYMHHTPILQIIDYITSKIVYDRWIYSCFSKYLSNKIFIRQLINWSDEIIFSRPDLIDLVRDSNKPISYLSHNVERTMVWKQAFSILQKKRREIRLCKKSKKIYVCSNLDKQIYVDNWVDDSKLVLLPNGKEPPSRSKKKLWVPKLYKWDSRIKIVFVWSSHKPNIDWLDWIHKTAQHHQEVLFVVIWSVWNGRKDTKNVIHLGFVSEKEKSQYLYFADRAINPIWTWWWSSLKIVDYLMHWLPIISSEFWMRWFKIIDKYFKISFTSKNMDLRTKTLFVPKKWCIMTFYRSNIIKKINI